MPLAHSKRARLFAVAGLMVSGACHDRTTPTAPPLAANTEVVALAGGNGGNNAKVKVKTLQLSSNTLRIDGPAVTATVSIGNSGLAIPDGVSIRAEIAQPAARHVAASLPAQCLPGDPAGFLPTGTCEMSFDARASNLAAGVGTLVPGPAVLVVTLLQTTTTGVTELASKTLDINLVAAPSITALTLESTTLAIDGPGTSYTVTMENPANSLQGVLLQGYIVQGATRRAGGGLSVTCGASIGVLPPGTCTLTFGTLASNSTGGSGTLVPGQASFELNLIQSVGGTETTFDTETVAITLVSSATIAGLQLASTTLAIGGPSIDYTAKLQNVGPVLSNVLLQGEIVQGTTTRGAGGLTIDCGAGAGVLPTTGPGTCTVNFTATASNTTGGTGTLVPGPANFVLHLYGSGGNTELDQRVVAVTLVSPTPTITDLIPTSSWVVLEGTGTSYSTTVQNPGLPLSGVTIQGWIRQGTARRAAGGQQVTCGGAIGDLPTGTCALAGLIVASNIHSGTGTLVPGSATFELEVAQGATIFDTRRIPITLVANTPSIVSIAMASTSIPLPGSTNYVVTLYNPTGAALASPVVIQGYVDQGIDVSRAGGGTNVLCSNAPNGELPTGSCVFSWTAVASNSNGGTGTLVGGAATFRLELIQNSTVLDTKSVAVTLIAP